LHPPEHVSGPDKKWTGAPCQEEKTGHGGILSDELRILVTFESTWQKAKGILRAIGRKH